MGPHASPAGKNLAGQSGCEQGDKGHFLLGLVLELEEEHVIGRPRMGWNKRGQPRMIKSAKGKKTHNGIPYQTLNHIQTRIKKKRTLEVIESVETNHSCCNSLWNLSRSSDVKRTGFFNATFVPSSLTS